MPNRAPPLEVSPAQTCRSSCRNRASTDDKSQQNGDDDGDEYEFKPKSVQQKFYLLSLLCFSVSDRNYYYEIHVEKVKCTCRPKIAMDDDYDIYGDLEGFEIETRKVNTTNHDFG